MSEVETENIFAVFDMPIESIQEIPEIVEEEEIEEEYKPRDYQERSFEDKICRVLDLEGDLMYERQKKIKTGIIDIFIYGQPPGIVEVKRAGTPFYLIQAIAQLKFYEMCFPRKCKLFIAVPGGIPSDYIPILKEFGIKEFAVDSNIVMWQSRGML